MAEPKRFKPVADSQVTITELMIPSYSNFGGKIHGGIVLSLIDKVAYAAASRHSGTYCVTLSVDKVVFWQPIEVGQLVSLRASVNYVGNTSLIVGVKVTSEDVRSGTVHHTNSCYLTMVAMGDDGQKATAPGLIIQNEVEARRWYQAWQMKQQDLALRQKQQRSAPASMEEVAKAMEGERGRLELL